MLRHIASQEPKPRKKKSVTLIVGIVCKESLILAAESETTRGSAKYQGVDKLHLIAFEGDHHAIIGDAGSAFLADVCIDAINRIARSTRVEDEYTIPKTVEAAFRELAKRGHGPKMGSRKCQEFYAQEDNYFQFLIGYYFNRKPYLYEFSSYFATARKHPRPFAVIGTGSDLAEYLLRPLDVAQMSCNEAVFSTIYAIGEVKGSVSGCGGPTHVAIVAPSSKPVKLASSSLETMEIRADVLRQKRAGNLEEMKDDIRQAALAYISGWTVDALRAAED